MKTKKVSKDERGLFRNGLLRARRVSRTFPTRRGRRRPPLRRASDERENAASRHAGNTPHAKPYESKSLRLPLRTLARFHHHARVLLVRALRVVGRSLRVISASVHEGVALHDASGEGSRVEQLMVGRTGRTGVCTFSTERKRPPSLRLRNPSLGLIRRVNGFLGAFRDAHGPRAVVPCRGPGRARRHGRRREQGEFHLGRLRPGARLPSPPLRPPSPPPRLVSSAPSRVFPPPRFRLIPLPPPPPPVPPAPTRSKS